MNNVFFIMATGPSINKITNEEWAFLKDRDTIGLGRFSFTGFPTKYNLGIENPEIDMQTIDTLISYNNFDTILLLSHYESIGYAIRSGFKKIIPLVKSSALFLPSRRPWFIDEEKPPHKYIISRAKTFNEPIFRYRGSLSATINASLILGADEIRLVGVDLNCQHNFFEECPDRWLKNEIVKKIEIERQQFVSERMQKARENRPETYKTYDPKAMHTTNIPLYDARWRDRALRPMIDVIQWMDQELREEGKDGIFITNKDSLLCKNNVLEYKGICDD